ncbi:MAG: hypothetical protein P4L31_02455 [Candidatus Babeliales bacterium]|nr:hypothetical protein [Candidatus Babeliales bacterium]
MPEIQNILQGKNLNIIHKQTHGISQFQTWVFKPNSIKKVQQYVDEMITLAKEQFNEEIIVIANYTTFVRRKNFELRKSDHEGIDEFWEI